MVEITLPFKNFKIIAVDYGPSFDIGCKRIEGLNTVCVYDPSNSYYFYKNSFLINKVTCNDIGGCGYVTIHLSELFYNLKMYIEFVLAKKGDNLYLIRRIYNPSDGNFYFVYPNASEIVLFMGYKVEGGKKVNVITDMDFNVVARPAMFEIGILCDDNKVRYISLPATSILSVVIVLSAMALIGVLGWNYYDYLKAREKTEAEVAKYNAVTSTNETIKYVLNKVSDIARKEGITAGDLANILTAVTSSAGASSALTKTPTDNQQDWWTNIVNTLKELLPTMVSFLGILFIAIKFNVVASVFTSITESFRGIFRRERQG